MVMVPIPPDDPHDQLRAQQQTPKEAYDEAVFAHLQVQNRRLAECESALFVNRLIVIAALVLLVAHLFTTRGA